MTLGCNVDFRWEQGHPSVNDALRFGISEVRCTSLPEMEVWAGAFIRAGIRVIAIYTSESEAAGRYVQRECSALQIGNEWNMGGDASWPVGSADDMISVWS